MKRIPYFLIKTFKFTACDNFSDTQREHKNKIVKMLFSHSHNVYGLLKGKFVVKFDLFGFFS